MSTHSVAEAKDRVSELIDHTLEGEDVIRLGHPVVVLKPVAKPVRPSLKEPDKVLPRGPVKVSEIHAVVRPPTPRRFNDACPQAPVSRLHRSGQRRQSCRCL